MRYAIKRNDGTWLITVANHLLWLPKSESAGAETWPTATEALYAAICAGSPIDPFSVDTIPVSLCPHCTDVILANSPDARSVDGRVFCDLQCVEKYTSRGTP